MLTRDDIIRRPAAVKTVQVPAWGGEACIRRLGGLDVVAWMDYTDTFRRDHGEDGYLFNVHRMAALVTLCLCDEAGAPILSIDDVPDLVRGDHAALETLSVECLNFNGMGEATQEAIAGN